MASFASSATTVVLLGGSLGWLGSAEAVSQIS